MALAVLGTWRGVHCISEIHEKDHPVRLEGYHHTAITTRANDVRAQFIVHHITNKHTCSDGVPLLFLTAASRAFACFVDPSTR